MSYESVQFKIIQLYIHYVLTLDTYETNLIH
jgi:hypothetical protein